MKFLLLPLIFVVLATASHAQLCPEPLVLYRKDNNAMKSGDAVEISGKTISTPKAHRDNLPHLLTPLSFRTLKLKKETPNDGYADCTYSFATGLKTGLLTRTIVLYSHDVVTLDKQEFDVSEANSELYKITTMASLKSILSTIIPKNEWKKSAICFDFDATLADVLNPQAQPSQFIYHAVEPSNQSIVKDLKKQFGVVGVCSADAIENQDKNKRTFLSEAGISTRDYASGYGDKFSGLRALITSQAAQPEIKNYILVDDSIGKIQKFVLNKSPANDGRIIGILYRAIRSQ